MIKYLRGRHVQRYIYIVIAVAVTLSFVLWGIKLGDEKSSPTFVGSIDNEKISVMDLMKSYRAVEHGMLLMYGERFQEIRSFINLKAEALDRIALLYYAKKNHIKASDQEVLDWVARQPVFWRGKSFDTEIYKRYVASFMGNRSADAAGSMRDFEEEIRQMLTLSKIRESLKTAHALSDQELETLYNQENGERDIAYGFMGAESVSKDIKVDDAEVDKIYPMLKDQFRSPAQAKIAYLFVPAENADKFKDIFDETLSMEELAKKYGLEIKQTEFFERNDAIPGIGLVKSVLDASFSLENGKESDWLHEDKGSYKIKVTDRNTGTPLPEAEARQKIKDLVAKQKAGEAAVAKLGIIRTAALKSTLEQALKDSSLEYKTMEKFKKGSYIPAIGPSEKVEKILSNLKQGEISEPFTTPNGAALITVLKDYPADANKFAEEKEKYRETVLNRKTSEELEKLLEGLRERMKLNNDVMKSLFPEDAR